MRLHEPGSTPAAALSLSLADEPLAAAAVVHVESQSDGECATFTQCAQPEHSLRLHELGSTPATALSLSLADEPLAAVAVVHVELQLPDGLKWTRALEFS